MNKTGITRDMALTPLYPPYFFRLIVEVNEHKKPFPLLWKFSVNLDLFILASGFTQMLQASVIFIAALLGESWADTGAAMASMTKNYIFSLIFVWFIKRSSF